MSPDTHGPTDPADPPALAALPWRAATMDDAPAYLDADTASSWAMGYNAAREGLHLVACPVCRQEQA